MSIDSSKPAKRGRPRSTSLPYVPIDPHLQDNAKVGDFVDAVAEHTSIPPAYLVFVPVQLWLHAGRVAADGNLGAMTPGRVARICHWDGPPQILFDALVNNGLLVVDGGEASIHDWGDYGGRAYAGRVKNAEKLARWRAAKGGKESDGIVTVTNRYETLQPVTGGAKVERPAQRSPKKRNENKGPNCNGYNSVKGKGKGKVKEEHTRHGEGHAPVVEQGPAAPGCVVPFGNNDISDEQAWPDDAVLGLADQERLLTSSQCGVQALLGVGAGATLGCGRVAAWELRRALQACASKPGIGDPKAYVSAVIRRGRKAGWRLDEPGTFTPVKDGLGIALKKMLGPQYKPFVRDEPIDENPAEYGEEARKAMAALGLADGV